MYSMRERLSKNFETESSSLYAHIYNILILFALSGRQMRLAVFNGSIGLFHKNSLRFHFIAQQLHKLTPYISL